MKFKKTRCALAAALLPALLAAGPAAAQDNKPVACKLVVTDAPGDQRIGQPLLVTSVDSPTPASENTDIKGLFFRTDGGKATANLVIANLDKEVPSDFSDLEWNVEYSVGDATYLATASVDSDGAVTYSVTDADDSVTPTKGTLFEGQDGVVQIVLPTKAGGTPGTKLTGIVAFTRYLRADLLFATADRAPDGSETADYDGALCGDASLPAGGGTTPPVEVPQTAPQVQRPQALPTFKLTATPLKLRAAKVKKAGSLSFALNAGEDVTGVTAQLKKGSKVVGKGSLAKLAKRGKLVVKLARKGLKKGTYSLVVAGKRADGSTGTATLKLSVR